MFQIYNEMIRDLLNPSSGILDLREDSKGGIQVAGLTEVKARSTDEVINSCVSVQKCKFNSTILRSSFNNQKLKFTL